MSPTKNNGEVREIVVEMESTEKVNVNLWRSTANLSVQCGANVEIWDSSVKYSSFLNKPVFNVSLPADIKV